MKAIIDLKLYDTDTAYIIHEGYKGGACGLDVACNNLYKTKNQSYFLHRATEFMGVVSEKIIPQSTEETILWLKNNDVLGKAIELFKDEIVEA